MIPRALTFIEHYVLTLSPLGKFSIFLVMLIFVPRLCRHVHVPPAVGLLLGGIIVGPYVLGITTNDHPIGDFFGELGKLFLMFFAGLDIDLALFRRTQKRSIAFGVATTVVPLVFGTAVGFASRLYDHTRHRELARSWHRTRSLASRWSIGFDCKASSR